MKNILDEIKHEMGASNAEDAEFLEMAEYFDSLDAEDVENLDAEEAEEYAEYLDALEMAERKHGKLRVKAMKHKFKKPAHKGKRFGRKIPQGKIPGGGGSWANKKDMPSAKAPAFGSPSYINQMMTQSCGDLNITVTRATANIASALPVVLFGLQGLASNFASMIKQFLPSGVTLVCSTDTNGDILFTFTAPGPLVDIIRVTLTGSQISYSEFLQSMNQNYFKTRYIRQEYVNDANLLSAVSQPINFGLLSALGAKNQNTLLPRSRRLNSDYQTFIVNVFLPLQKITSDFSFVQNVIAVANQTIAYDVFMAERTNLNNV